VPGRSIAAAEERGGFADLLADARYWRFDEASMGVDDPRLSKIDEGTTDRDPHALVLFVAELQGTTAAPQRTSGRLGVSVWLRTARLISSVSYAVNDSSVFDGPGWRRE
jgi:hypothetical protein